MEDRRRRTEPLKVASEEVDEASEEQRQATRTRLTLSAVPEDDRVPTTAPRSKPTPPSRNVSRNSGNITPTSRRRFTTNSSATTPMDREREEWEEWDKREQMQQPDTRTATVSKRLRTPVPPPDRPPSVPPPRELSGRPGSTSTRRTRSPLLVSPARRRRRRSFTRSARQASPRDRVVAAAWRRWPPRATDRIVRARREGMEAERPSTRAAAVESGGHRGCQHGRRVGAEEKERRARTKRIIPLYFYAEYIPKSLVKLADCRTRDANERRGSEGSRNDLRLRAGQVVGSRTKYLPCIKLSISTLQYPAHPSAIERDGSAIRLDQKFRIETTHVTRNSPALVFLQLGTVGDRMTET
jgi:hypothetical protein